MGDMRPGQGYYVNVDAEEVVLVYRLELPDEEGAYTGMVSHSSVYDEPGQLPVHAVTGVNMSLLVLADQSLPAEIGVYTDGKLIGSGVLQNGICGIAIWGDDPSTTETDGALEGQSFEIRLLTGEGGHFCPPRPYNSESAVNYTLLSGEAIYQTDGFAVIQLSSSLAVPVEFGIQEAYPNPFNSTTSIDYQLPEESRVILNIFDLSGREISTLVNNTQEAGSYRITWDAANLPSGIYYCRMEAGEFKQSIKLSLIR